MKKSILVFLIFVSHINFAQNIFPNNGNVGIGTDNPTGLLHLNSISPVLKMTYPEGGSSAIRGLNDTWIFGFGGNSGTEDISIGTQDGTGSRTLTFAAGGSAKMKILSNGNVGIGTNSPTNKLDVNGTIHSKEVKVDMNGWSDFVFKKKYNLPTLEEVEKHINEKGHLANIPSEAEVLKNGINLGEMNARLLQKIEEMTLYMIEMKKENESLKNNQKVLEKRIQKIENK